KMKIRSKSPTYLRNKLGELRVRRSSQEEDKVWKEKVRRKSLIDSSMACGLGDSISNDTATTATISNDSFASFATGSPPARSKSSTSSSRKNRTVAALCSPKSAKSSKKMSSSSGAGRKVRLSRQASLPACLPLDDSTCCSTVESRGRKKDKKDKKKKKKRSKSEDDVRSIKSDKKKKKRSSSVDPTNEWKQAKRSPRPGRKRDCVARSASYSTESTMSSEGSGESGDRAAIVVHWKTESHLKEDVSSNSSRSKLRSTVDANGKIHRVHTPEKAKDNSQSSTATQRSKRSYRHEDDDDDDDDNRSHISRSSRSSHRSRRSASAARTERRSLSRKPSKTHDDDESSFADDSSTHSGSSLSWRDFHKRSQTRSLERSSNLRHDSGSGINPIKGTDLQKEIDSLQEELLAVKEERSAEIEEAAKLKKELRENKLEMQRIVVDRGELRSAVRDKDQVMKQKDCQIAALEKAVESQLDKVDELEEELERAQLLSNGLVVKDPSDRSLKQPNDIEMNRLLQQNKSLQRALDKNTEDADSVALTKDQEIEALKQQISQFTLASTSGRGPVGEAAAAKQSSDSFSVLESAKAEAIKAEAQVMKSKWEGAQRRNRILEDDIEHWKSLNCSLEDDLREMKAEVAIWKARYDNAAPDEGTGSSPGDLYLKQLGGDVEGNLDASQRSISSLWSKSVRSLSNSLHRSVHSTHSREDTVSRATFLD
ncbi:MAG: hypothetical protein SGILL_000341, partial [Bacillariaceae sp.]